MLRLSSSFSDILGCQDKYSSCSYWAGKGYYKHSYVSFMKTNCMKSCNLCGGSGSGGSGQCGYKPSVRIVGGTEAPRGAWPWQAQINSLSGFTFCGGTLVHPNWIVTAAHCVPGKSPFYRSWFIPNFGDVSKGGLRVYNYLK